MKNFSATAIAGILLSPFILFSQPAVQWESTYHGPGANDKGNAIALDSDGNVYIAGVSDGANFLSDYIIIKYNTDGDTVWTRRFNGSGNGVDIASAIKIDHLNNVYVTGKSEGIGTNYDIVTIKYNPAGVQQWIATYNASGSSEEVAYDLAIDLPGNVYVTGATTYNSGGVLIKYSPNGNQLWSQYLYAGFQRKHLLAINSNDGNLIVTGGGNLQGTYYVKSFNPVNGNVIQAYNTATFNHVNGIAEALVLDGLGNIYVTSVSASITQSVPRRITTAKFNYPGSPNQSYAWVHTTAFDSGPLGTINGVATKIDIHGNLYVLGKLYINPINQFFTKKINATGSEEWQAIFNSPGQIDDIPVSLLLGKDIINPHIFELGYTSTGNFVTVKYNNDGDLTWSVQYDCGNNGQDVALAMAIDSDENLYITGYSSCSGTYQDIKTIKYCTVSPPANITPNGPSTFCQGGSVTLTAETCTGCTYLWSTGDTSHFITVSPSFTTAYTVEVTNESGCSAISDSLIVTVLPGPDILISGDTAICQGSSTVLTASGADAGTYSWLPTSNVNNPNIQNPIFSPPATTTYTVTGTLSGCPGSASVTITVTPLPSIAINGANSICAGESTELTALGANQYSWSPTTGLSDPNIANLVASPDSTTTYTVTGTTAGCASMASFTVEVTPIPPVLAASCGNMCMGDTCVFTVTGAETYNWSPAAILSNPGTPNPAFTPPSTGAYTFVVTGTTQGCSAMDTVVVNVNPVPNVFIIISDTTLCAGDSTLLSAYGAQTYSWFPPGSLSNPNISNPWAIPLIETTYTLTGTLNGCTGAASVTITVNPIPNVVVVPDTATICQGESTFLNAYGAISYSWSPVTGLSNPSIPNPVASPSQTTVYVATGTIDACSARDTAVVVVNSVPVQPGLISGPATVCSGDTVTYAISQVSGADSYNWNFPAGWVKLSESHSASVIAGDSGGQILVKADNECGESEPRTLQVSVNITPPQPFISSTGNVITSNAAGGDHIWYRDDVEIPSCTGPVCIAEFTGDYHVEVEKDGCVSSKSNTLFVVGTGLEEVSGDIKIEVFPNPTEGTLIVQGAGLGDGDCRIRLTTALGQALSEWQFTLMHGFLEARIDLEPWPAGTYFLTIQTYWGYHTVKVNKF